MILAFHYIEYIMLQEWLVSSANIKIRLHVIERCQIWRWLNISISGELESGTW